MVSKEEFNKVFKDTSREGILNQFYYEHIELGKMIDNFNELEKDVENRLMSIPDDMCDDALEEIKRTTKIAVYQVVLGKLQKLNGSSDNE